MHWWLDACMRGWMCACVGAYVGVIYDYYRVQPPGHVFIQCMGVIYDYFLKAQHRFYCRKYVLGFTMVI